LIYFDSAASYPVLPEVQKVLQETFSELYGNSTASHTLGVAASDEIEKARNDLADVIGAYASEIVFTSGATESNNIAFKSILLDNPEFEHKRHIVTSEIEHKCVLGICHYLQQKHNFKVTYVKPDRCGIIDKEAIEKVIQADTAIVSIMHVNNELGTINPIGDIGKLCFENGILFHSDAAQSLGKTPIDVDESNVDIMSFSAHKIGGPKGIGAIYIRDMRKRSLSPVIHGAGQEDGLRGGTVAAPLIKSFAKALQVFPSYYTQLKKLNLKSQLMGLLKAEDIEFIVNGSEIDSLPNIVSISMQNIDLSLLLRSVDGKIALAQGSACSSKQIEPSHVLLALGLSNELGGNTLRISFSHLNNEGELASLVKEISKFRG
jgi:cysteine desulfurase